MKSIGGFFELEIGNCRGQAYHGAAVNLWCGRACLKLVLSILKPHRVFVPFYTCNSLLEPIIETNLNHVFYNVNQSLEIADELLLEDNDYLIYINYFGLKERYVKDLLKKHGKQLIIDNTQAFFSKTYRADVCSFNSARKFFGVPDGAYLYAPFQVDEERIARNTEISCHHLINRFIGKQSLAYREFHASERSFSSNLKRVSLLSEKILEAIDYRAIASKRQENFAVYHQKLGGVNLLRFSIKKNNVPFCYPLLLDKQIDKQRLYEQSVFVPTLWADVVERENQGFEFERRLADCLLPLPCDHRYDTADCNKVINIVEKIVYEHQG